MNGNSRIVYVVNEYPGLTPNYGGIAVVVKNEVEYFLNKGYLVHVILVIKEKSEEKVFPDHVIPFYWPVRGILKGLRYRLTLIKTLNNKYNKSDIVVTADYAGLIPWKLRSNKIVQLHESLALKASKQGKNIGMLTYLLEYFTILTSNKIRAVSNSVLVDSCARFPFINRINSKVIYNGTSDPGSSHFEVEIDEPRVIFIGKLSKLKGVDFLEKIINSVQERIPNSKFTIIGHDETENGISRREVLRNNIFYRDSVLFIDRVNNTEITRYLFENKLLILPSRTEALPMVVLEAFSCALPVVAFNVGGLGEMLNDGNEGFLISRFDTEMFSNRIVQILLDPALQDTLSKNARKKYESSFEVKAVFSDLEIFYLSENI